MRSGWHRMQEVFLDQPFTTRPDDIAAEDVGRAKVEHFDCSVMNDDLKIGSPGIAAGSVARVDQAASDPSDVTMAGARFE
jgi:hypothetical protein